MEIENPYDILNRNNIDLSDENVLPNPQGRTANEDGNKTGGGGKGWAGLNSFADFMHNLLGGNTTNNVTNETGSSKMSAGVWIAIGGVLLVVVVLVVVLATRNK